MIYLIRTVSIFLVVMSVILGILGVGDIVLGDILGGIVSCFECLVGLLMGAFLSEMGIRL